MIIGERKIIGRLDDSVVVVDLEVLVSQKRQIVQLPHQDR